MNKKKVFLLAVFCSGLCGCGRTGPLYLPPKQTAILHESAVMHEQPAVPANLPADEQQKREKSL